MSEPVAFSDFPQETTPTQEFRVVRGAYTTPIPTHVDLRTNQYVFPIVAIQQKWVTHRQTPFEWQKLAEEWRDLPDSFPQ